VRAAEAASNKETPIMFDLQPPDPPSSVAERPAANLTVALINATVQIDQPSGEGTRTVGTGFLLDAPRADGTPRTVLVTAGHVLDRMPASEVRIGWRVQAPDGGWRFAPQPLQIRGPEDTPLWALHPSQDIAVMEVIAPRPFARAAIPLAWLADEATLKQAEVGPGDELLSLGFPRGLSANRAGFPIVRAGRIASWPLTPIAAFQTFLLDFAVFPGNSGGPVFWTPAVGRADEPSGPDHPYVAGMLIQEVVVSQERLGIGVVAHAAYIREAVALLDAAPSPDAP
jgi:S1-C subfamily serine protease